MSHKFFLSHFSEDKQIAEIISKLLRRLSLQQLLPWYSSDAAGDGGLRPGNIWFNEILERITESKALIAILTPNSIDRPWIYFESGIAQALNNCELIPVSLNVKRDNIAPPLGMYQCYQLTDYNSLMEFTGKLLNKFGVVFDEEMSRPVLMAAIKELSLIEFSKKVENSNSIPGIDEALSALKNHIDKRFIDLLDQRAEHRKENDLPSSNKEVTANESIIYTATINVNFPEFKGEKFVEIRPGTSVQDVLDNLYGLLGRYLHPYTYMENWILINPKNKQRMILREIGKLVPARYVFRPEITWEAIKISSEYKASSSAKLIRNI
jgi:hypothetical protein